MELFRDHGLGDHRLAAYFERDPRRGAQRLYTRLWAEARQTKELAPSFALIRRYWVMAATYDGVAIALGAWWFLVCRLFFEEYMRLVVPGADPLINVSVSLSYASRSPLFLLVLGLLLAILACWHEAGRYAAYQREELVATIAQHVEATATRSSTEHRGHEGADAG
jgi:hypothetical protein